MATWHARDRVVINNHARSLDRAVVNTAYTSTNETQFLSCTAMIFSNLPIDEIVRCSTDLSDYREAEYGQGELHWTMEKDCYGLSTMVTYALRHMLTRTDKGTVEWRWDCNSIIRHFCLPEEISQTWAELACKTLFQLAVEDQSHDTFYA